MDRYDMLGLKSQTSPNNNTVNTCRLFGMSDIFVNYSPILTASEHQQLTHDSLTARLHRKRHGVEEKRPTNLLDFFGAFDQLVSFWNRSSIASHPESLILDGIIQLAQCRQSNEADRKCQACKQPTRRQQNSRDVWFVRRCPLVAPNLRCSVYLRPRRGTISQSI